MAALPLSPRLLALPLWGMLSLRAWIAERRRPLLELRLGGRRPSPTPRDVRDVADSPEVRGLRVRVQHAPGGWANLASLREAFAAVRRAGKLVVFELEQCGNGELYLASVGDRVWIRPMTTLHVMGVGASMRFAGAALAKLGLRFDMEAAGAYKSFGETFTRSFATPENREAIGELVRDIQDELERGIAEGRRIEVAAVREAIADAPLDPEEAVARGLVDGALYPDAVLAELERMFEKDFARMPFWAWHRVHAGKARLESWMEGQKQVTVVHLEGPVVDGDGVPGQPSIAARPVCKALEELAEDDEVAGAVLAIKSPGGSATASDLVWRAVQKLQEKKPVVAVFGDVAASGGYYIAAPAAEIIARANTLTGSIGVVGGKLVVGAALARLGVHTEHVLGAPHADYLSAEVPFDDVGRARFRAGLERFYRGFVERVAAGRRRPYDAVEPFARGRVWTGRRALEVGLVDRLGGVEDGVARVAALAGVHVPRRVDVFLATPPSRLMRLARSAMEAAVPQLRLLPTLPPEAMLLAESRGAPLVLLPWEIDVE
ncbi:MAG: S49 family peptidase [Myxococcota bacterium]